VFNNLPAGNPLVSYPNNSDYYFTEIERERINGQAVVQFRPADSFTVTADLLYAENENKEQRSTQGNWFNRPFSRVDFDTSNDQVATAVFLEDTLAGPKDIAWGQQLRMTKDTLESVGLNLRWDINDSFGLEFDGHTSSAKSDPNGPDGKTSYDFAPPRTPSCARPQSVRRLSGSELHVRRQLREHRHHAGDTVPLAEQQRPHRCR
jgi:hypothetical protein